MRVLIAEDDMVSRKRVGHLIQQWGYQSIEVEDGLKAWAVLKAANPPQIILLDWMMPNLDGPGLCKKVAKELPDRSLYTVILSAKDKKSEIVQGLESGADDYLPKPFHADELRARLNVGVRTLELRRELAQQVRLLKTSLAKIRQLNELLPICCYCKNIRDDKDYWHSVENYIAQNADVQFTHGICPQCMANEVWNRPPPDEPRRTHGLAQGGNAG